ncbi:MAG: DNA repair exonuclease [Clostridiales bacterium]|jgi:DNA repair exonuclease SbcCD nuclease subunit|nr:DNA repair exonuclease [Clostridiales bacterium]
MVKLIHAADFHLDSPFSALAEDKAVERRREQRSILEKLKTLVIDKNADLLVLSGDLLDSGRPYAETYEQLIGVLSQVQVPVFISPGNHDYYSERSPYASVRWPDNVHIFNSLQISGISLPELNLRVWGAGFLSETAQPILRGFTAPDRSVLNIMTLHGDVGKPASPYNPITEEDIAKSGLDYLALGHVHMYSGLKQAGHTFYAYPGCPEGRGFDETGIKGAIYTEIREDGCKAEFIPLGGRRYEVMRICLDDKEDIAAAILSAVPENTRRDIYRLILSGSWDERPDTRTLTEQFGDLFYQLEILDRTNLRVSLWAQAGEDSLKGLFLNRLKERYDSASSDREREVVTLAARYGLAALTNRDAVLEGDI